MRESVTSISESFHAPVVKENFEYQTFVEALKNYKTYMLMAMIVCSSGYGLFIASVFKPYGATFEPTYLTLVGSIGAVLNGIC